MNLPIVDISKLGLPSPTVQASVDVETFKVQDVLLGLDGRLRSRWVDLIVDGKGATGDRSSQCFSAVLAMLAAKYSDNEILTVFTDPQNYLASAALERRGGNRSSAVKWFRKYVLEKAKKSFDSSEIFDVEVDNHSETMWTELPAIEANYPPLTPEMLPPGLREWIEDSSARMGVPLESIAVSAVTSAAMVVGSSIGVTPKEFDEDWVVVSSVLWGAIISPSGSKKSASLSEGQRPLKALESRAWAAFKERETEIAPIRAALDAKIEGLKSKIKEQAKKGQSSEQEDSHLSELLTSRIELDHFPKRYTTQDATKEKLGEILSQNHRGIGVSCDELVSLIESLDKKGQEGSRGFYLSAWNGTSSETVDRIGRGTVFIPRLSVIVVGGIQPEVLASYISEVHKGGRQADGLLARFQLAVMPDPNRQTDGIDRKANLQAFNSACKIFEKLDDLSPEDLGSITRFENAIPTVHFTEKAQQVFNRFISNLETKLKGNLSPALASHLSKYRSTMPALALVFHIINWCSLSSPSKRPSVRAITQSSARLAVMWCEWLEDHARAIYGTQDDRNLAAAHLIAEKIRTREIKCGVAVRTVSRKKWRGLSNAATVQNALEILQDHGWISIFESRAQFGRPSTKIRLHPDFAREDT